VFDSERFRYGAYAVLAAAAALAYFLLDFGPEQRPIEATRKAIQNEELPVLQPLDSEVEQEARRDLFAFGGGGSVTELILPPASSALDQSGSPAEKPSLLANVQALGVVRRSGSVTILVQVGTQLLSVGLGEPFGEGDALYVESIGGRDVVIVEKSSGNSRNFRLSEE
jgi:hypothetical protein